LTSESTFETYLYLALAESPTGGTIVAAEVAPLTSPPLSPQLSPQDVDDFVLDPTEVAKGRAAAENYLNTFRSDESRKKAKEALETLATVFSGGKWDGVDFPWQQVRPYHGAAALTILKEKGAPGRIEALRCRRDTTRNYRVVPESYPPGQVQNIRSTLNKVIAECSELGFLAEAEAQATPVGGSASSKGTRKKKASSSSNSRGRILADGELRALIAASIASGNAEGCRDAVFFALVYRGLKIAEITSLTLDSVRFSNKTGACNIVVKPTRNGGRGRRVELSNDELICLEDWLDFRDNGDGPLLCTLGRGGKVENKRLTIALLKELCERRAQQAEVEPFVPNDLSRSAEALTEHRKAQRKKSARLSQEAASVVDQLLLTGSAAPGPDGRTIQFPYLGLGI
jgi:integrase